MRNKLGNLGWLEFLGFLGFVVPSLYYLFLLFLLFFLSFLPDMVIVDEILPSGDGMQVCSQLHSTFGIPVVLLGEDSSDEVWGTLMEASADLYLIKPFRYRELAARVNWCDGCR